MSLTSGIRLGPYEIVAPLGAGGMGEVYRGRDTKLNRDVAIKILPDVFAHDTERVARFAREAQTLASLNHPNIAQIYGVIEEDQPAHVHALVMELVEGEDLSTIIARHAGPDTTSSSGWSPGASAPGMPFADVLSIAKQIAEALEAAHEQGVIHRDLKPANVKVRPDGTVKVLDFGLAKALDANASGASSATADAAHSPTLTARATQMGMIIGTAAYMAPEQARGKAVDRRADIWAFGVVLYEMLTGQRAFHGEDVSVTLASVIKEDVNWHALPADVPASVRRLLRRCLEKDPKRRLSAIGDARLELDEPDAPAPASGLAAATSLPVRPRWHRLAWAASTMATLAVLAGVAWVVVSRPAPAPPKPVFAALPIEPAEILGGSLTFSPDGSALVFVGRTGTASHLYRRALSQPSATLIAGTEGATMDGAAFSPDGKWLAFRSSRLLKKIPVEGGSPTALGATRWGRPEWGPDNTIIANMAGHAGLSVVPAAGGTPTPLTRLDAAAGDVAHEQALMLPGGKAFLYIAQRNLAGDDEGTVMAQPFEGGAPKALFQASWIRWLPPGDLLFVRNTTAMRVAFDPRTLTVQGEPVSVIQNVVAWGGAAMVEPGAGGSLAYVTDPSAVNGRALSAQNRLVTVAESGVVTPIALPEHTFSDPRVSPDGARVVVHGYETGRDNWVADLKRGTLMRLTFDPGEDETPIWSPDGRWIVWTSTRADVERVIYRKAADGSGSEELLWKGKGHLHLGGFAADGKTLVISFTTGGPYDIGIIDVQSGTLTPMLNGPYGEYDATISPDGRWLAYASDEAGRPEVYVPIVPLHTGTLAGLDRRGQRAAVVARRPAAVLPGQREDHGRGRHAGRVVRPVVPQGALRRPVRSDTE